MCIEVTFIQLADKKLGEITRAPRNYYNTGFLERAIFGLLQFLTNHLEWRELVMDTCVGNYKWTKKLRIYNWL